MTVDMVLLLFAVIVCILAGIMIYGQRKAMEQAEKARWLNDTTPRPFESPEERLARQERAQIA